MQYRKKPVIIEAVQWGRMGDHAKVNNYAPENSNGKCKHCDLPFIKENDDTLGYHLTHGWIETLEGGHIVCPKDFIITGVVGECYPCKPDVFEATYEKVETN